MLNDGLWSWFQSPLLQILTLCSVIEPKPRYSAGRVRAGQFPLRDVVHSVKKKAKGAVLPCQPSAFGTSNSVVRLLVGGKLQTVKWRILN